MHLSKLLPVLGVGLLVGCSELVVRVGGDDQASAPRGLIEPVTVLTALTPPAAVQRGDQLTVTYRWEGGPTYKPLINFIHFVDSQGSVPYQDDHWPAVPTDHWAGGPLTEARTYTVPATAPEGTFRILLGLYAALPEGTRLTLKAGPGVVPDASDPGRYEVGRITVRGAPAVPPSPPVFTRAYSGAKTGRADRRWSWKPAPGSAPVERYYVKPSWAQGFYTTATSYQHSETIEAYRWHSPLPLPPGVYSLSVQAANAAGTSPATIDTLRISYFIDPALAAAYDMNKQDMGLAGCEVDFEPGKQITNAVAIRYKFHVVAPEGIDGTKILFGGTRVSGPAGSPYAIEQQFYTRRPVYADAVCDQSFFVGPVREDETSVSIKIADYVTRGKPGIKTFAPAMFPRLSSLIDGIPGVTNENMWAQTDLGGKDGVVEFSRAGLVADKDGWKCVGGRLLDSEDFREWKATVTLDGTPYHMSLAIPDASARYLAVNGMQNFRTEFFLNPGYVKFYFWDIQIQREGSPTWEALNRWKVGEFVGYTTDFGVRRSVYQGVNVIELSNDAPGDFFPKDHVFDLSAPCSPASCAAQGASCGPVSDGCGGTLDCGSCVAPQGCGAGGVPKVCGAGGSSGGSGGSGGALVNLALTGTAAQSSTLGPSSPASVANDGNTSSYSHTNSEFQAWWRVDLGAVKRVETIKLWNRIDCCAGRVDSYWLEADPDDCSFDNAHTVASVTAAEAGRPTTYAFAARDVRCVRLKLKDTDYLNLAELEVWGR